MIRVTNMVMLCADRGVFGRFTGPRPSPCAALFVVSTGRWCRWLHVRLRVNLILSVAEVSHVRSAANCCKLGASKLRLFLDSLEHRSADEMRVPMGVCAILRLKSSASRSRSPMTTSYGAVLVQQFPGAGLTTIVFTQVGIPLH